MANTERPNRKKQLIDAAEALLIAEGPNGVSTRRVAAEAGMNQALVHYHFGSMTELTLAVLDRMSDKYAANIVQVFHGEGSLVQMWRRHCDLLFKGDVLAGWPKIWLELSTLAINQPELRDRLLPRLDFLRTVLNGALEREVTAQGLDIGGEQVQAIAALWATTVEGLFIEKLLGYDRGHTHLVAFLDAQLVDTFGDPDATAGSKRSPGKTTRSRTRKSPRKAAS